MDDWRAILAVEGSPTGDGRFFDLGAFTWRDLPLTLMYQPATDDGHDGAFPIGSITSIERLSTGGTTADLIGRGTFADSSDPAVLEAQRMIREGHVTGVSVDFAADLYRVAPFEEGVSLVTEDGRPVGGGDLADDDEAWVQIENVVNFRVQAATILAATVVATPAFAETTITLEPTLDVAVASGAYSPPEVPPGEWYDDPQLERPTPLRVLPSGRIFGHLAAWGTCHIGMPGCFTPPRSATNYSLFRLGEIATTRGPVAVGQITMATGHADLTASAHRAREHYDDTGVCVADVAAGEDPFGIWVAGAIRPGLTAHDVAELRAAKLSGDWRRYEGNLEMVAALAVNVPGFPVPRGEFEPGEYEDEAVSRVAAGAVRVGSRRGTLEGRITHLRLNGVVASIGTPTERQALEALAIRVHGRDLARLGERAHAVALEHLGRRLHHVGGPVGDD
jgi:hypothetical protein